MKLNEYVLDRDSGRPLYLQLHEALRNYIETPEALKAGVLPRELELCTMFNVSRNTVSQALGMLAEENLVRRIRRRGTVLASSLDQFDPRSADQTIGLVFPISSRWDAALAAIEEETVARGYRLEIYSYKWEDTADMRKAFERARKNCSGVILYPSGREDYGYIENLSRENYPLVLFAMYYDDLDCDAVGSNVAVGSHKLAQWLLERGCRRIAAFCWLLELDTVSYRFDVFREALRKEGVELLPELCGEITGQKSDQGMFRRILSKQPDGIFCSCFWAELLDELCLGGMTHLPVAQCDISPAGWNQLDIATAEMPKEQISRTAVQMLCRRIRKPQLPKEIRLISPNFIIKTR